MARWLRFLPLLSLLAIAAAFGVLPACGNGEAQPCRYDELVCASDGKLYCRVVPANLFPLEPACCLWPPPPPDAGPADASGPLDGALADLDAGSADLPPMGGGSLPEDGGVESYQPAEPEEGSCGDGGLTPPDGGWPDGMFPTGRDDAGLKYIWRCGMDLCHMGSVMIPDVGCTNPFGCAPPP